MKKKIAAVAATALLMGTLSSGAMAFNDLEGVSGAVHIQQLRQLGVVNGIGDGHFAPRTQISAQQAVPLIVKGLQLSLDRFRFIKQPLAGDYFSRIADDAWYAEAFVIARMNGLDLDPDIDPAAPVSREQFTHWLMQAVATTGEYAQIMIYILIEDEEDIAPAFSNSIQSAVIAGIAGLDRDGAFRPQQTITRAEAAIMVSKAIRYVAEQQAAQTPSPAEDPIASGEVSAALSAVTADVQKLVLSWGEKPHAGWRIHIEGVDFPGDGSAVVRYSLRYPDPAALYAQVITEPTAAVYLASDITDIRYELVFTENMPEQSGSVPASEPDVAG